jgi:hypothetical protein
MIQFFDAMGLNEKHLLTQLKRMQDSWPKNVLDRRWSFGKRRSANAVSWVLFIHANQCRRAMASQRQFARNGGTVNTDHCSSQLVALGLDPEYCSALGLELGLFARAK